MPKSANVCSALRIRQEIHRLLVYLPLEEAEPHAEAIAAEETETAVLQGTVSPTLQPINLLRGLHINQTSSSIIPMSRSRGALLARDLLVREMNSPLECRKVLTTLVVVVSALLLEAARQVPEVNTLVIPTRCKQTRSWPCCDVKKRQPHKRFPLALLPISLWSLHHGRAREAYSDDGIWALPSQISGDVWRLHASCSDVYPYAMAPCYTCSIRLRHRLLDRSDSEKLDHFTSRLWTKGLSHPRRTSTRLSDSTCNAEDVRS